MAYRITPGRLAHAIVALLFAAGVCDAQPLPSVETVVDRLGAYLLDYETKVFELAAEEQYEQWIKRRSGYGGATVQKRRLRSTYFLVRLPDGQAWYGFRDVSSVDGRAVSAPSRPMEQLLGERTLSAYEEALALTRGNAKYNIGDVYRTINIPLQTLELLHPQYRNRFDFSLAGRERVRGQDAAVVGFSERATPSLDQRWVWRRPSGSRACLGRARHRSGVTDRARVFGICRALSQGCANPCGVPARQPAAGARPG